MTDRKKVINELRFQLTSKEVVEHHDPIQLSVRDAEKILALLKEHEPVEPWLSYDGNEYIFHCSNCDYEIYHNGDSRDEYKAKEYAIFCRHCGRKVKWDE